VQYGGQRDGASEQVEKLNRNKVYVCPHCLNLLSTSDAFDRHLPDCSKHQRQKVKFPDDDDLILKWKSRGKTQMCPFVIYCDFQSVLKSVERQYEIDGKSYVVNEHIPSDFCSLYCFSR
jgi:hypothetical protein